MPYKYVNDEHRIGMIEDVMSHAREVFEQGLQLEAILLSHEYLEQKLNVLYRRTYGRDTIHRRFKQLIDLLRSERVLHEEDYAILNQFNRLRNVNANQILDFSLTLRGAKKGDMERAMNLAEESEQIISSLAQDIADGNFRKGKKSRRM